MNYTYVDAQSSASMHCGQMKMKMLTLASGLIASVLVFSFMLKVPQVHAQTSCDYYASPNGTGNGLSPSTPFQISKFWPVATPGKTLCLLDGTYTDDNSLIQVPTSFAGTASQPITIRAVNDGKVLIDSGGRRPINLEGSYGILEGINSQGADNAAIRFRGSHWTVRRVVIWNNGPNDDGVALGDFSGDHNTLEDCAIFGKGRIVLTVGSAGRGDTYNTVRRCWLRWEYRSGNQSPSVVSIQGYVGQSHTIFENILATRARQPGSTITEPYPPFHMAATADSKLLGSIAYVPPGVVYDSDGAFFSLSGGDFRSDIGQFPWTERNLVKDLVAVADPSSNAFQGGAFDFTAATGTNNVVENAVAIWGNAGICQSQGWSGCSTIRHFTSLQSAQNSFGSIWTAVPGICHRYVDGQLTNQPLWPWPMNQRIKDALVQSGRAPVDITQTMEELLGSIPQVCTTGEPPPAVTLAPRNLRVIGAP
jgi:hypothetical protein